MTGNLILDLLISAAGVVVLVALSWVLGGWRTQVVDESAATARLAFDEPDFAPEAWLFDRKGAAGVAISADGTEAAAVFGVGDGFATRRFNAGAVKAAAAGEILMLDLGDPSKWRLRIRASSAEEASRWALRLRGKPYIIPPHDLS